ncbi:MAG: ester cyclase [Sphingomonas sp.]
MTDTLLTPEEQKNLTLAREYMRIAYTPGVASAEAVRHLCAPGNRFVGPTTFPGVTTLEAYADAHGALMEQLDDLRIVDFDVAFVRGDRVAFRYTAEGAHKGKPHGALPATGATARWTAAALFRVEDGRLVEFVKEWNKLAMWEQLGWPLEECLSQGLGARFRETAAAIPSAIRHADPKAAAAVGAGALAVGALLFAGLKAKPHRAARHGGASGGAVRKALHITLKARSGQEQAVEQLLAGIRADVEQETGTRRWFGCKRDASTFEIFETFDNEAGREAHVAGAGAARLMAQSNTVLSAPAQVDRLDLMLVKEI